MRMAQQLPKDEDAANPVSATEVKRLATEIGTFGKNPNCSRCYAKRSTVAFGSSHNTVSPKSWGSFSRRDPSSRVVASSSSTLQSCRCPLLPVALFPTALLFTALVVSLSSIAQVQNCGAYPFFFSASDSVTRFDPFQPPIGPLRNESTQWTWTLPTASFNNKVKLGASLTRA